MLLRGHSANPWDLRPWELLADSFDVSVLVTGSNAFDLSALQLRQTPVRAVRDLLPRGRAGDLAVLGPGDRYLGLARHLAGADIVHSAEVGPWFSWQPAVLKQRLGYRLVLTVWETIPLGGVYRSVRGRAYRGATLRAADLFLAATERAREALLLEGADPARSEVSYPGIDRAAFAPGADREPGLIVSPGRLVWEKGHQDVIRALAALRAGLAADGGEADFRLLIVGAGPEEARLRRHAAELGVGELVEFRRSVPYPEMPAILARASCVVLASLPTPLWEEQFGMVLAEAMAAGTPVIAAASGAIPEVVGEGGTLFQPGDWLGLARLLAQGGLVRPSPELVERYATEAAAERLAAAYERLLARPSSSS